jgi:hypothetical protein
MSREEDSDGMVAAGSIILVEQLQDLGINAGDITKLKAAGIYSVTVSINLPKYAIRCLSIY